MLQSIFIFIQTYRMLGNPYRIIVRNAQFSGTLQTYMHCINNALFILFGTRPLNTKCLCAAAKGYH